MLTDYDKKSVKDILEEGHGDWYTAILLRYIGGLTRPERNFWALRYAQEVKLLAYLDTPDKHRTNLYSLMSKADHFNAKKIAFVLRSMADKLDKKKTA